MARSTYVYLITGRHADILGAFTVKHEAKSWLQDRTVADKYARPAHWVIRMRDGGREPLGNYIFTVEDFLKCK